MKIIFLTRRFWPDRGGVEKHVYEISKILIKKGHSVTVVTESMGKSLEIEGIKVVRMPYFPEGKKRKFYIWLWMLRNREIFQTADVVHAHDVYYQYFPLKLIFLSKKSFITFHGYETYPITKKAILIRKISEKLATGNIIVGSFMKKWYRVNPNSIIYGGVKIPKKNIKAEKLNSAIFIGRLDEHTGIMEYAKATEEIKKTNPRFSLKILGEGPYFKRLAKFRPIGFKENSSDYLPKYEFAFVSRYLSILEALASKRLVFALYDNPVKKDYLEMTPFINFIITADSPGKLARKIKYFQKNPKQANKFINAGYKWVKDQSWENVADTYLKLWRKRR